MKALIPVIFMVGMGWSLFFHPAIFTGFVETMLVLVFAFLALVFAFAFYAEYRQKKGNPIKGVTVSGGWAHIPAAFVGLQGNATNLQVQSAGGKLFISMTRGSYVFILAMCLLFGPGGMLYFMHLPPDARLRFLHPHSGAELYVFAALTAMIAGVTLLFFYYLRMAFWSAPVVEVNPGGIILWHGHKEMAALARHDIARIDIRVSQFNISDTSTMRNISNYTLCVIATSGNEKGLCITASKSQTDAIKNGIERMLNLPSLPTPVLPDRLHQKG